MREDLPCCLNGLLFPSKTRELGGWSGEGAGWRSCLISKPMKSSFAQNRWVSIQEEAFSSKPNQGPGLRSSHAN